MLSIFDELESAHLLLDPFFSDPLLFFNPRPVYLTPPLDWSSVTFFQPPQNLFPTPQTSIAEPCFPPLHMCHQPPTLFLTPPAAAAQPLLLAWFYIPTIERHPTCLALHPTPPAGVSFCTPRHLPTPCHRPSHQLRQASPSMPANPPNSTLHSTRPVPPRPPLTPYDRPSTRRHRIESMKPNQMFGRHLWARVLWSLRARALSSGRALGRVRSRAAAFGRACSRSRRLRARALSSRRLWARVLSSRRLRARVLSSRRLRADPQGQIRGPEKNPVAVRACKQPTRGSKNTSAPSIDRHAGCSHQVSRDHGILRPEGLCDATQWDPGCRK